MEILYNSGTVLIILGLPFFLSGTVGLIRFHLATPLCGVAFFQALCAIILARSA